MVCSFSSLYAGTFLMTFHLPKPVFFLHWNVTFLLPVLLLLTIMVCLLPTFGFFGSLLIWSPPF